MLKPEMIEKLNEQMNGTVLFTALSANERTDCSYHTFEGAAAFLRRHARKR